MTLPLLAPNLRNPILYLLLENFNKLLVGIDQGLLFFNLCNDLAKSYL